MTYAIDIENGPTDIEPISVDITAQQSARYDFIIQVDKAQVPDPQQHALSDITVNWNASALFEGEIDRVTDVDGVRANLEGFRGKILDRGSATVSYSDIAAHDAIDDYYQNHLPAGVTGSVVAPTPTSLATDELVQEADTTTEFQNIFSADIDSNTPLKIQSNQVELLQTCFFAEGEFADRSFGTPGFVNDSKYSDGTAEILDTDDDALEWDFTVDYTIPASDFEFDVRYESSQFPDHTFTLQFGGGGSETLFTIDETGGSIALDWQNLTGGDLGSSEYAGQDIPPGTHTIRLDHDGDSGGADSLFIDAIAPNDGRFNYTFDNSTDANDLLSGPELFPDAQALESEVSDQTYNITAADLTTVWDDTTNNQKIEISNDGGSTYELSANNASTLDASFTNNGTQARTRLTFSRYGSRTTASPTTGFNGQVLSDYELRLDGNDLAVIDSLSLRNTHFDNLKELHKRAQMRFVMDFTGNIVLESFKTGDVTKPTNFSFVEEPTESRDLREYANKITVFGAGGLSATISDSAEVSAKGEVVKIIQAPELTTQADVESRARSELGSRVAKDRTTGSGEIIPQLILPGYSYTISEWGTDAPLEEVRFTDARNGRATLDFRIPTDTTNTLLETRRTTNSIGETLTD